MGRLGRAGLLIRCFITNFARVARPRAPTRARDAELLALLDRTVEHQIRNFAALLLPPLGFDEAGILQYRSAALSAFRAALPTN
jgi:hypothetical protein